ncbi:MAG: rhamnan synthesis F family protein [Lactovum sp.]
MTHHILLYVHFNKENQLSDYVTYQLKKLRPLFERILFVSNSELSQENQNKLLTKNLIDDFISRENKGYNFKAWSEAMQYIGFEKLMTYDSVSLMDDTCFGPVGDFESIFEAYSLDEKVDFWGLTNNREHSVTIAKDVISFREHIQSYFVSYKQNLVKSSVFREFWENIESQEEFLSVTVKYESEMSSYFEKAGFNSAVLFDTRKLSWERLPSHDFSIFGLSELLQGKVPFLKIKAFSCASDDSFTSLVVEKIRRDSDFPIDLILEHMTKIDGPDRDYMLRYKTIQSNYLTKKSIKTVGIHLHVYYVELLDEFVQAFENHIENYDLYITTNSEEKKEEILSYFERKKPVKEVIVTASKGRDVLPWQVIHERLEKYEIAGHFHTKKSVDNHWIIGESWRHDLIDSLIKPASLLFTKFEENPKLGILIPDVVDYFNLNYGPTFYQENTLRPYIEDLWEKMGYDKEKLAWRRRHIMSYGTMVWYRPKALKSILDLDFLEQIPEEPLPIATILHAFERLLIYVAWMNGYDFKISQVKLLNGFHIVSSANRMLKTAKIDPPFRHLMFDTRDESNQIPVREILGLLKRKAIRRAKSLLGLKK